MQKHLACLVALFLISVDVFADEPAWRYVAEVGADSPIRPVFRFVALSNTKPDDLAEEVQYRGKEQKYAQIRYGSDDSRRVVVVVDEVSRDDFDLYVDANRNRVIEAKDKIAGTGKDRTAPLDVEITRGLQIVHERRLVQWRLAATRKTISLATLGYVEGVVFIAGKKYSVRRVDGNANGFFADAADRLWIDLNMDKQWDPITEQFPFAPVITLNNQRYAIRGDAIGSRLAIDPLTSEGRIRLRLGELAKDVSLLKMDVMLTGEDGSAFAVSALETPTVVPAGRYALGSVALSVQLTSANQPIHFVFSRVGVDADTRWHELKKDQELILDPVGKLRFGLEIEKSQRIRKPGATIRVQPQLFTADGLLINSCSIGDSADVSGYGNHKQCTVKLSDTTNQAVDVQSSGFA
ncbi:MAG TPA: hypothetical protein VK395_37865 [Gemmataceae bacterium]|nr:hypothetical protein [Gemmataceae bacterium]